MSLRLYDFECLNASCGRIHEALEDSEVLSRPCPHCQWHTKRIISASGVYTGNLDAVWTRSVLEVVDKENPARHVQEFVKNPNRQTYKAWMKGEGLRPADDNVRGAPPVYERHQTDTSHIRREVMEKFRQRRRIEVR